MGAIAAGYPEREQQTWAQQVSEADALAADPAAVTPFIDAAVAADPSQTHSSFAARVRANRDAYAAAAGALTGRLHSVKAALAAAIADPLATPASIAAIVF